MGWVKKLDIIEICPFEEINEWCLIHREMLRI